MKLRATTGNDAYIAPMEKKKRSIGETILQSVYRPMQLLALEPMCLNLCIFSALLLGILYLFFGAFGDIFREVYGFQLWQVGASFLGILVGMLIAMATDPFWKWNYQRLERNYRKSLQESGAEEGKPLSMPEWRLPQGTFSDPAVCLGLGLTSS